MTTLRTLLLDGTLMHETRQNDQKRAVHSSVREAVDLGMSSLKCGPYSVVSKPYTPPSGDKHDYVSMGPYWWPNPETADGLPYIRKDGEVNPQGAEFDGRKFAELRKHLEVLAVSYYYTGHEQFAAHAMKLLETWFLNPETKMNPHLDYGQMIPGICDGRAVGVIDTWAMGYVLDHIALLETSAAWSALPGEGIRGWFSQYLHWLRTSPIALKEEMARNNHGTYYDDQTAAIALYLRDRETAARILSEAGDRRIGKQVMSDGSQPHELERTLSLSYSIFNLNGLLDLAIMARTLDIDLLSSRSGMGGSIRDAIDYLLPYLQGVSPWPYTQIGDVPPENVFKLMRRAANAYGDAAYEAVAQSLELAGEVSPVVRLSYPAKPLADRSK